MADSPGLGIVANFNPEIANELPEMDIRLNSKLFRTRLWPTGDRHTQKRSQVPKKVIVKGLVGATPAC